MRISLTTLNKMVQDGDKITMLTCYDASFAAVMDAAGVDLKRWPPQGLMPIIQRWKDRGLTPARVSAAEDSDFANNRARALYAAYQERLRQLNTADFGDLLLLVVEEVIPMAVEEAVAVLFIELLL